VVFLGISRYGDINRCGAASFERGAQLGNGNLGYLDHAVTKRIQVGASGASVQEGLGGSRLAAGKSIVAGRHLLALFALSIDRFPTDIVGRNMHGLRLT